MLNQIDNDQKIYNVVINDEGQYSIWPANKNKPEGWSEAGFQGLKKDCLLYIKEAWKDMRPLSLQRKMAITPESEME
ncbi:MbtH family protein [Legionella quinlivanii]|uniref:MbtH family protein n=1 Tax=Legionella quinlivanii TaxID=45073 RepID=UPI000AC1B782|nr:MbtH family NRPS accessory protein [Legionella quinlivanii]STY10005.1 Uncharacterized protein conserved in bacteria [Legionella quinlivanii]